MHLRMNSGRHGILAALPFALFLTLSGCDGPSGDEVQEATADSDAAADLITLSEENGEDDSPAGDETLVEDPPAGPNGPGARIAALGADGKREVLEGIATILGSSPESVELDEPILNPGKEIEEFDLLEILIELEDRFDVEIDEDSIERITGGRFDEIQKKLTPRQLFDIVAEATRAAQQSNANNDGDEN